MDGDEVSCAQEKRPPGRRSRLPPPPPPIVGRVAVVGPCAAGKSVLVERLVRLGYDARSCAQEHSHVPDMWRRLARPQVLVYLEATWEAVCRRKKVDYGPTYLDVQRRRLEHARRHAHLLVDTDELTEEQVLAEVRAGLERLGVRPTL